MNEETIQAYKGWAEVEESKILPEVIGAFPCRMILELIGEIQQLKSVAKFLAISSSGEPVDKYGLRGHIERLEKMRTPDGSFDRIGVIKEIRNLTNRPLGEAKDISYEIFPRS